MRPSFCFSEKATKSHSNDNQASECLNQSIRLAEMLMATPEYASQLQTFNKDLNKISEMLQETEVRYYNFNTFRDEEKIERKTYTDATEAMNNGLCPEVIKKAAQEEKNHKERLEEDLKIQKMNAFIIKSIKEEKRKDIKTFQTRAKEDIIIRNANAKCILKNENIWLKKRVNEYVKQNKSKWKATAISKYAEKYGENIEAEYLQYIEDDENDYLFEDDDDFEQGVVNEDQSDQANLANPSTPKNDFKRVIDVSMPKQNQVDDTPLAWAKLRTGNHSKTIFINEKFINRISKAKLTQKHYEWKIIVVAQALAIIQETGHLSLRWRGILNTPTTYSTEAGNDLEFFFFQICI